MYRGVIVEKLETTEHLEQTVCHPYSKSYFAAVPVTSPFCVKKDIFLFPKAGTSPPHKDVYFKIVVHTVKTSAKNTTSTTRNGAWTFYCMSCPIPKIQGEVK